MNSSNVSVTPASTLHKAVVTTLVAVAFFLNSVCITFTGRIAYRKPRWPNVLLVHIGALDLCAVLMVLLPMTIALYVPDILGHVHFCRYQGTVLNVWYIFGFGLLVQIMFDRYFAITHPFVYSKRILESNALIWSNAVFVGVTIVAILIASLPVATNVEFVVVGPGLCFWNISQDGALPISTVNVTISLVILVALVFLTGGIGVGVFNILRRTHVGDADNVSKGANKTEVNFVKLAIVTSLVFGASSIPFIVILVLQMSGQYVDPDVQYIVLCILMVNVLLNPILHSAIRRPVRRALLVLAMWLLYVMLCCRSPLKPKMKIDEALGLINKPPATISATATAGVRMEK